MATIKDVAKLAGVSVATVSRVINQSPKAGAESIRAVQAAMKELAYRPNAAARALVSQSSDIVGVLVGMCPIRFSVHWSKPQMRWRISTENIC